MCGTPYLSQRISVLVAAAFWASSAGAELQPARTRTATRTGRYDLRMKRATERSMGSPPGQRTLYQHRVRLPEPVRPARPAGTREWMMPFVRGRESQPKHIRNRRAVQQYRVFLATS